MTAHPLTPPRAQVVDRRRNPRRAADLDAETRRSVDGLGLALLIGIASSAWFFIGLVVRGWLS